MVQDNPKQEELHEMIKFIAQNKQIYIYMGDIILAKNISKYLYYARIQFCGFIKPEIYVVTEIVTDAYNQLCRVDEVIQK